VGSGRVFGVSAVGGSVGVCEAVDDDVAQPVSRMVAIHKKYILFIFISMGKYT